MDHPPDDDPLPEENLELPDIAWDIRREGRSWSGEEVRSRYELTPEKFEVWDGKLFFEHQQRMALLGLLLENVGLDAAVRLGDPRVWRDALDARDAAAK
jgi:hypothetical protein